MRLSNRQFQELAHLERANKPLWGGVAAKDADRDLEFYINHSLVVRVRDGYKLSDQGRATLRIERARRQSSEDGR